MRLVKRYIQYLVLSLCLIGLLSSFFITIAADKTVKIPDPNLEAAIREVLDRPTNPIPASELSKIKELNVPDRGITSLVGLEYCSNLTVLNLEKNHVHDVSPLSGLRKLKNLNLRGNGLTDLRKANFAALAGLPLKEINLDNNVVVIQSGDPIWLTDISVLGTFSSLRDLTLTENKITDISPLAPLKNLRTLDLEKNQVEDLSAVQQMRLLKTLNLGENNVVDLQPLAGLTQLTRLYLHSNENIASTLPLASLHNLKTLTLDDVHIRNEISVLANMRSLEELSLANTQITEINPLQNLIHLTSLSLRENDIIDLHPLANLTTLLELDIQSNQNVASILPIENLIHLKKLDLQGVPVGEQVSALGRMRELVFLDARNCAITDTAVLGSLMVNGALQDKPETGQVATVDIRDNAISVTEVDAYGAIRGYWKNIHDRLPFLLPEYNPLAPPVFSAPGGYYENPFALTLTTDLQDAEIYYTLDGSTPTRESKRYTAPIKVQNRAGEPNTISEIADASPNFEPPNGEVFKATVIRARVIDANGAQSPTVTSTFLVDAEKRYTLPVISVVTDPIHLFDHQYGIYVMGDIFDLAYDPDSGFSLWEVPANYNQHGAAWERPIHIEYFETNGVVGFSQDAAMRIHGAASRAHAQKTMRIYADCEGLCQEKFAYELFPELSSTASGTPILEFKTFLLRNAGNDWEQSMFRDALSQSLLDHTPLDIQAYQPSIVFLNGEYWGIHNLRERIDRYYVENHYGIASEDIVILTENGMLEEGEAGDEQPYLELLDFVKTHDMAAPENYAYIKTLMDVENYIDYQILEIYVDNGNWPHANIKFWRKKTETYAPDAPYGQDGRWRWLLYDTDFAFGLKKGIHAIPYNSLLHAIDPEWHETAGLLFQSLLKNPDFKTSFLRRFADHMNTSFTPERVLERIDQMQSVIEPEMEEHIRRWWGDDGTLDEWEKSIAVMRSFAKERPQYVQKHIIDYFGLSGVAVIHLETDPEMGYIRINTIDIDTVTPGVVDPGAWTGMYFQGIPVEITAVPRPGYRFERWEGFAGDGVQTAHLSITPEQDTSLRAVFSSED